MTVTSRDTIDRSTFLDRTTRHSLTLIMSDLVWYAVVIICACLSYAILSFLYYYLYLPYTVYLGYVAQNIKAAPFRPFVGQLPEIVSYSRQDKSLDFGIDMMTKYGSVYVSGFGPTIRLVICDADYLCSLLKTNAADFSKGNIAKRILSPLIGPDGLFLADEPLHNRNRKLIAPMFHHESLRGMIDIIARQTATAIDETIREVDIANGQAKVEVHQFFSNLTLAIIASTAFGAAFDTDNRRVKETVYSAFTTVLHAIQYRAQNLLDVIPIINAIPFPSKLEVDNGCRAIADVVRTIIADRKGGRTKSLCAGNDLLDLLLQARHSDGQSLDDEQIMQESLTAILAGHETTSNLLCWISVEMCARPDVWQECRDEVDRVCHGNQPTADELNDLVSVDAVVREVLRLSPPAPMHMREAIRDTTLAPPNQPPIKIGAGSVVLFNLYALHRSQHHWGANANTFDHRRWIKDSPHYAVPKHPFAYAPFSGGNRSCIGAQFALYEAKCILTMLLQRLDISLCPDQKIVREMKLTIRPKYGLNCFIKKRQ